ncbi:hypothetical protein ANCCAN_06715 [Ancylostoma caninum]|uniref:Uncharacterized protein n=1 Tax=Ancylostoma caninum TaxID=29170 RepID=A0A368GSC8_ANCCA|nr:hypothetical protein ANCCAN_06715 [Ancylostoma caninum]
MLLQLVNLHCGRCAIHYSGTPTKVSISRFTRWQQMFLWSKALMKRSTEHGKCDINLQCYGTFWLSKLDRTRNAAVKRAGAQRGLN